jgi:hypothetical protein
MITGKELRLMVEAIPDDAIVLVNGNQNVRIVDVDVSTYPWLHASINLTPGYSITSDAVMKGLFNSLSAGQSKKDF